MAKTELETRWLTLRGIPAVRRMDLAVFETCPRDGSPGSLRIINIDGRTPGSGKLVLTPISGHVEVHLDPKRPGAPTVAGDESQHWSALRKAMEEGR